MKQYSLKKIVWLMFIVAVSCKEPYTPPAIRNNSNFLVVDGTIVLGNDSTIIYLSRTSTISDTITPNPELGAGITVVGTQNDAHPLTELGNGEYYSPGLNLNATENYQLKINCQNGEVYQSDFVTPKQAPPIDSVGWAQDSVNNVQIYVTTHDPTNNSRYYRWDYTETWQYNSPYRTLFDYENGQVVVRTQQNQIYNCWVIGNSSQIEIASTAKLAQDVINQAHIATVPNSSEKIGYEYSMLVKQYVLTPDAYNFWQTLQTTTQQLGTLFDQQPTQLASNIHCVSNPAKIVIGYASVSSLQAKRIFIANTQVAYWNNFVPYYDTYVATYCNFRIIPLDSANYFFPPGQTGIGAWTLYGQPTAGTGYIIMPSQCLDCRTHGGTNVKPPYWP